VPICTDPDGCGGSNGRGTLIGGIVVGACVVFIIAILVVVFYRRKRLQIEIQARLARERAEILAVKSGGKLANLFTIKEIHKATNDFAGDRLLGVGGFGEVYK
ncbi:hypothetical protein KI387_012279, partial [Taxus chinensis]